MSTAPGPEDSDPLQSVARAVRVLRTLATGPRRPTELVTDLDITWATLHRTLSQLERDGLVEKDADGRIRVGRQMWVLGGAYLVGLPLAEIGLHHIREASQAVPSVAFQLCVRSRGSVAVLAAEQQSMEEVTMATYGFQFPLHCGSKGQVLLAHFADAELEEYLGRPLVAMTSDTETDPDRLRALLAEIREHGLAKTLGDVQPQTGSVAAPVRDGSGAVVASVTGITFRRFLNGGPFEEELTNVVAETAAAISRELGERRG